MRARAARAGAVLTMSAIMTAGLGLLATPASAQESGLTFYSGTFATRVANVPAPTGACTALPPTADSHVGWSGFRDVTFYQTPDCSGQATGVGTLRTYEAGRWTSFRAV
ncbi:hypothetical protein DKT68_14925 [Micromonospora acroterricola]|uniref:Uncharacterized protein n=1 Tax=Micromonospora acroterricola TaxID=2202421 RepID=A0A317D7E7_9ACTN|nr:hypothetical protein [Micromonospora acroterricola]PWR08683.1 hypothetical protein DKT68_14925 [Micromonospora acroterricola]